ncbi:DUF637 domain-containing protein [uncultured Psychrobacter sp.]|uniref:DUF637 domain-containing protein n=1 Tax=uncultured Psychrobacter sp. TaxID=259303 RepID=UPI0025957888|nr:DUF637 domain-containing protein [uncultured Psychrobacter sp.]
MTVAVPVEVTVDANNKAKTNIQKSQEELGKIALNLSKQPGYEYLATLDKDNDINWVQVDLIQKNWDYTQEGLTSGAAALIAIAITVAAGPAGSGLTASMVTTNAAGIALQTQAVIMLINNKGNISKTLKDMASSDTIRNMATAALTAGVGAKLGLAGSPDYDFSKNLANGIGRGLTNAVADAAFNGVSFEEALKNSLSSSLVDILSAEAFAHGTKDIDSDRAGDLARNLAHKLAAGGVGCLSAKAKNQNCDAGALGAIVGEMVGDYMVELGAEGNLSPEQISKITNAAKLSAGTIAMLAGVDVDIAANSAGTAVENNSLQELEMWFPNEDIRDPNFSKKELEAIKRLPDNIAAVHEYYNDMTIVSFNAGMVGYTVVINNKNGNMWVTGVEKINKNGQTYYSVVPEVGINLNISELAKAVSTSNGKVTRPVGVSASVNFGSILGGGMEASDIDEVIKGSSVGGIICHGACLGGIYTKSKDKVFTYGIGSSQVGVNGGNMVQVSAQKRQQVLTLLGIKK